MNYLFLLFACLGLLVSSVSGFSTYVTTSGSTLNITTADGNPHWYSGFDLVPGAYLAEVDLSYANLTDADLSDIANLNGADLSNVNLTNADLQHSSLSGADLSNANLTGAILIDTRFYDANLSGADLSGAIITNAYHWGKAKWTGANLYGAILPDGYDQDWFEEQGAIFVETVPEPSTYALLLGGTVLGYAFWRRRK